MWWPLLTTVFPFPDQQAVETILHLAETYTGHAQNLGQQATGTVRGAHADDHLRIAEQDLKVRMQSC